LSTAEAEAYPLRIAAAMERWDAEQMIWATPGCFQDEQLERGSLALDAALSRHLRRASERLRDLPAIHSGRMARCANPSHDGIHPTGGCAAAAGNARRARSAPNPASPAAPPVPARRSWCI